MDGRRNGIRVVCSGLLYYYRLCTYAFLCHSLIMLQLLAHTGKIYSEVNFPQNEFLRKVKIYFQDFLTLMKSSCKRKTKIAVHYILQPKTDKTVYL